MAYSLRAGLKDRLIIPKTVYYSDVWDNVRLGVYSSDFQSDTNGWSASNGALSLVSSYAGKSNALKIIFTTSNGGQINSANHYAYIDLVNLGLTIGKKYRISGSVYIKSSNAKAKVVEVSNYIPGNQARIINISTTGSWVSFDEEFTLVGRTLYLWGKETTSDYTWQITSGDDEYVWHNIVISPLAEDTVVWVKNQPVYSEKEKRYYYAKKDILARDSINPAFDDTRFIGRKAALWGGVGFYNNRQRPKFFWKPFYNSAIKLDPRKKSMSFGDGYEQRWPQGINNSLLTLNLSFENIDEMECLAINHFLMQRGGAEPFVFMPPAPYNASRLFTCKSFSTNVNFYNNYSIAATFDEDPDI